MFELILIFALIRWIIVDHEASIFKGGGVIVHPEDYSVPLG